MICEKCHGAGRRLILGPRGHQGRRAADLVPCDDCGGYGFRHCCEGDQCEPEPEEKNDD